MKLYLLVEDYPRGPLDSEEMLAVINSPAYWAFCWASGQVLAGWILNNRQLVSGRSVLDFGCGSGIAGIAAAMAGARNVVACDIDPHAREATRANAKLNGVHLDTIEDVDELGHQVDLVIAADVLYDRDNLSLLTGLKAIGRQIVVADSRIGSDQVQIHGYRLMGTMESSTVPDLDEHREYNQVRLYQSEIGFQVQ